MNALERINNLSISDVFGLLSNPDSDLIAYNIWQIYKYHNGNYMHIGRLLSVFLNIDGGVNLHLNSPYSNPDKSWSSDVLRLKSGKISLYLSDNNLAEIRMYEFTNNLIDVNNYYFIRGIIA